MPPFGRGSNYYDDASRGDVAIVVRDYESRTGAGKGVYQRIQEDLRLAYIMVLSP